MNAVTVFASARSSWSKPILGSGGYVLEFPGRGKLVVIGVCAEDEKAFKPRYSYARACQILRERSAACLLKRSLCQIGDAFRVSDV